MILFNHDGAYFDVTSDDVKFEHVAREDVISLDVVEEMAKMETGSIQLLDPNHVYSRIIRPGAKLKISWGIRNLGQEPIERTGVEVMVNSPSGSGEANGQVTFNCSFAALGFRGDNTTKWYESGTKADVVADVFSRMGISLDDREINFQRGTESVSGGLKVAQYESDFRFLVRMADEWRAAFRVGRDQKGCPVGCFIDYGRIGQSLIMKRIGGGGDSLRLEYGGVRYSIGDKMTGNANVLSYSWQDRSMDSANGAGARVVMVDGQPQIFRTVVENETVKTYRLVPERIEAELSKKNLVDRTALMEEYLLAKDFEDVKRFFVEDTTTTAPQGSGITVSANMMGNPYVTAGMVATFGPGFPDRIGAKDRTWWIRKASHSMSTAGYFTALEIADAYSFSATGTKLMPVGGSA